MTEPLHDTSVGVPCYRYSVTDPSIDTSLGVHSHNDHVTDPLADTSLSVPSHNDHVTDPLNDTSLGVLSHNDHVIEPISLGVPSHNSSSLINDSKILSSLHVTASCKRIERSSPFLSPL